MQNHRNKEIQIQMSHFQQENQLEKMNLGLILRKNYIYFFYYLLIGFIFS